MLPLILEQLRAARREHDLWKDRFVKAIARGERDEYAPAEMGRTELCELGRWLGTSGAPRWFVATPEFPQVLALHAEFHQQAEVIATLVVGRRYQDALAALRPAKSYDAASQALLTALEAWEQRLPEAYASAVASGAAPR